MPLPCYNLGLSNVNQLYGIYSANQLSMNDYYVRVTNNTTYGYGWAQSDFFNLRGKNQWGYAGQSCQLINWWTDEDCGNPCGDPWSGCCQVSNFDYVACGGGWTNSSQSDWSAWGSQSGSVCADGNYQWTWSYAGWQAGGQGGCGGGGC